MFLDIWKTRNLVHRSQYFKIQSFNGLFVCHNFFNFNLFYFILFLTSHFVVEFDFYHEKPLLSPSVFV